MIIQRISFLTLLLTIGLSACSSAVTPKPTAAVSDALPTEASDGAEGNESGDANELDAAPVGASAFILDPDLSEARFIIGEILANSPNTVVGVNKLIQGGGVLNFARPDLSTLSEFLIDASGFETDSSMRNRAIRNFILQSGEYPVITFQPTDISGIPSEITVGEKVPFEVVGLLTIRAITQEVGFAGEAVLVAENRVQGLASATVFREDFQLSIPSVPRVAGVDEVFILEIEFVALSE